MKKITVLMTVTLLALAGCGGGGEGFPDLFGGVSGASLNEACGVLGFGGTDGSCWSRCADDEEFIGDTCMELCPDGEVRVGDRCQASSAGNRVACARGTVLANGVCTVQQKEKTIPPVKIISKGIPRTCAVGVVNGCVIKLKAKGGSKQYAWEVIGLPGEFSWSTSDKKGSAIEIVGTPADLGDIAFDVAVSDEEDEERSAEKSYSIKVNEKLSLDLFTGTEGAWTPAVVSEEGIAVEAGEKVKIEVQGMLPQYMMRCDGDERSCVRHKGLSLVVPAAAAGPSPESQRVSVCIIDPEAKICGKKRSGEGNGRVRYLVAAEATSDQYFKDVAISATNEGGDTANLLISSITFKKKAVVVPESEARPPLGLVGSVELDPVGSMDAAALGPFDCNSVGQPNGGGGTPESPRVLTGMSVEWMDPARGGAASDGIEHLVFTCGDLNALSRGGNASSKKIGDVKAIDAKKAMTVAPPRGFALAGWAALKCDTYKNDGYGGNARETLSAEGYFAKKLIVYAKKVDRWGVRGDIVWQSPTIAFVNKDASGNVIPEAPAWNSPEKCTWTRRVCPEGDVLTGVRGFIDDGEPLRGLAGTCGTPTNVTEDRPRSNGLRFDPTASETVLGKAADDAVDGRSCALSCSDTDFNGIAHPDGGVVVGYTIARRSKQDGSATVSSVHGLSLSCTDLPASGAGERAGEKFWNQAAKPKEERFTAAEIQSRIWYTRPCGIVQGSQTVRVNMVVLDPGFVATGAYGKMTGSQTNALGFYHAPLEIYEADLSAAMKEYLEDWVTAGGNIKHQCRKGTVLTGINVKYNASTESVAGIKSMTCGGIEIIN